MRRMGAAARLVLALTLSTPVAAAGDPSAGARRIKALGCIACHGRDGLSKLPEAPNLAGQGQIYLTGALQAYRSGARKNELMNTVAGTLSDTDIDDLSAYYSAIAVTVGPPPKP